MTAVGDQRPASRILLILSGSTGTSLYLRTVRLILWMSI